MKRSLCLSLILLPLNLIAADFTLIRDNHIALQIEHTNSTNGTTRYAASELRETLHRMANGEIEIAPFNGEATSTQPRIVIGVHSDLPKEVREELPLIKEDEEEVLIQEHNGTLWITGPTERAALYATYTFLQETGGVRWLWPGDSGTRIPRHANLVLREPIRQTPDIPFRSFAIIGHNKFDDATHVWMARNRVNVANISRWHPEETRAWIPRLEELGFLIRLAGHSVVLPRSTFEKHPEYMALFSGERRSFHHHGPHLCWSNPNVQKALIDDLLGLLDRFPQLDIMTLYVSDHSYYCQCEGCVAMAPNITTRWQELSKILIPPLRKRNPKLRITSLAYTQYRPVPETTAPYDEIGYTTSDLSYRHFLSSGSQSNAKALANIRGWQEKGVKVGLRQYEMIGLRNPSPFMPLVSYMADQMSFAKANGLTSYTSEISSYGYTDDTPPQEQHWNVNRMNAYTATQAMWNSAQTGDTHLRNWATHAYSTAAPAMEKYYLAMETAWRQSPKPIGHYYNDASTQLAGFISPSLIKRAETHLREAMTMAEKIEDRAERHAAIAAITLDERMFGVWRRLYRNSTAEGDRSIYRLLPHDASRGELAWQAAPEVTFTQTDHEPAGVSARMLATETALKVRTSERGPFTIRLHSVSTPGTALEVKSDAEGNLHTGHLNYGEHQAADFPATLTVLENGDRELTINAPEVRQTLEKYGTLYVSLHTAGKAQWPDAPLPYGSLVNTPRPTPRLGFIDSYNGASNGAHHLLRLKGWESRSTRNALSEIFPNADLTLLNYGEGKNSPIQSAQMREQLTPYFERGGVLMVYAKNPFPVEEWTGDKTLIFQRVGKTAKDIRRRLTETTRPGKWLSTPNELPFWKTGATPINGFLPEHPERWTTFATILMTDGQEVPWLMATPIGKGWLVVTSEPMGYGGGFSVFGHRFNERLGLFIENLMTELPKISQATPDDSQ